MTTNTSTLYILPPGKAFSRTTFVPRPNAADTRPLIVGSVKDEFNVVDSQINVFSLQGRDACCYEANTQTYVSKAFFSFVGMLIYKFTMLNCHDYTCHTVLLWFITHAWPVTYYPDDQCFKPSYIVFGQLALCLTYTQTYTGRSSFSDYSTMFSFISSIVLPVCTHQTISVLLFVTYVLMYIVHKCSRLSRVFTYFLVKQCFPCTQQDIGRER